MTDRHPYVVGETGLEPDDHEARMHLASIPPGERVYVTITRDRGVPAFAELVYATFREVGNAMNWRVRNVRGWLAIKTGRADVLHWPSSESRPQIIPHSTSPSEMNRVELEAFWLEAREVIREEVLPYVDHAVGEQISFRIE